MTLTYFLFKAKNCSTFSKSADSILTSSILMLKESKSMMTIVSEMIRDLMVKSLRPKEKTPWRKILKSLWRKKKTLFIIVRSKPFCSSRKPIKNPSILNTSFSLMKVTKISKKSNSSTVISSETLSVILNLSKNKLRLNLNITSWPKKFPNKKIKLSRVNLNQTLMALPTKAIHQMILHNPVLVQETIEEGKNPKANL